jgi:hypothetical protein
MKIKVIQTWADCQAEECVVKASRGCFGAGERLDCNWIGRR